MTGNGVCKVLHFECPFHTGGKETTKWCYDGRENGKDDGVELDWGYIDCGIILSLITAPRREELQMLP